MSTIDLSPELSALSLHPATGPSSSLSSGAATPLTLRSSTGSGATTPPNAGEQHSNGHTVPAVTQEAHESSSPESVSYEGASPNGVDQTPDKRRPPVDPTERRTIFIPNLPRDATLREMELLFHFFPGFIKVQMYDQARDKDVPQTVAGGLTYHGAFALFESPQQAAEARDRVQGMVFDRLAQPNPWLLQCKLAHKNVFDHEDAGHSSLKSSRRSSQSYNVIPQADLFQTPMHSQFSPLMSPLQQGGQYVQPGIQSGYGSPALGPFPHQLTPPAMQSMQSGYFSDSTPPHAQQNLQNVFNGLYTGGSMHNGNGMSHSGSFTNGWAPHRPNHGFHSHGHGPGHYSHAGPNNPPCTTLFLARLDHVSDEDLYNLLVNTFGPTLKDYKFMVDSRGQRIAFVEFDSIESASQAQPRISGYQGMTAAFSKNPLNKRLQ